MISDQDNKNDKQITKNINISNDVNHKINIVNQHNESYDSINTKNEKNAQQKKSIYTKVIINKDPEGSNKNIDPSQNIISPNNSKNVIKKLEFELDINKNFLEQNFKENENNYNILENKYSGENIELEDIKSYEFLLLDLNKFPLNFIEKITNGELNKFKKLNETYIKEKFSKIVEFTRYTKFSANTSYISSSSRNNSYCNDSINSTLNIQVSDSEPNNIHNFQKIKFTNKIISDHSNKFNVISKKNLSLQMGNSNIADNKENILDNIGIDEKFLLDLIIKDLVLITNIKYEMIEKVINLLIKINYVLMNLKLRENFIFTEYPNNKKFLKDKILSVEKRIEEKYEKIKTNNFLIKKTEIKINEINKHLLIKKNELDENKNYLKNIEMELNSMKDNEEFLKSQIQKYLKEKESIERDYDEKILHLNSENHIFEKKIANTNKKLRDLNDRKNQSLKSLKDTNKQYFNQNKISSLDENYNSQSKSNTIYSHFNTFKYSNFSKQIEQKENLKDDSRSNANHSYNIDNKFNMIDTKYVAYENDANEHDPINNNINVESDRPRIGSFKNDYSSSLNKFKRKKANMSNGNNICTFSNINTERLLSRNNNLEEYNTQPEIDFYNNNFNEVEEKKELQDDQHEIFTNIKENNQIQYKTSFEKHKSSRRNNSKCSDRQNNKEFKVNNNIYTKYQVDNKFKNPEGVSKNGKCSLNSFKQTTLHKHFKHFKNDNNTLDLKSNYRNGNKKSKHQKNSSLSSQKSDSIGARKDKNTIQKYYQTDLRNRYKNYFNKSPVKFHGFDNSKKNIYENKFYNSDDNYKKYIDSDLEEKLNSIKHKNNNKANKNADKYSKNIGGLESKYKNSKKRKVNNQINEEFDIQKNKIYVNKNEELKDSNKNIYKRESNNNTEFFKDKNKEIEDIPNTSIRKFRNKSSYNFNHELNYNLNKISDFNENVEKDKSRYLITQNENNDYVKKIIVTHNKHLYNHYNSNLTEKNDIVRGSRSINIRKYVNGISPSKKFIGDAYYEKNNFQFDDINNEIPKENLSIHGGKMEDYKNEQVDISNNRILLNNSNFSASEMKISKNIHGKNCINYSKSPVGNLGYNHVKYFRESSDEELNKYNKNVNNETCSKNILEETKNLLSRTHIGNKFVTDNYSSPKRKCEESNTNISYGDSNINYNYSAKISERSKIKNLGSNNHISLSTATNTYRGDILLSNKSINNQNFYVDNFKTNSINMSNFDRNNIDYGKNKHTINSFLSQKNFDNELHKFKGLNKHPTTRNSDNTKDSFKKYDNMTYHNQSNNIVNSAQGSFYYNVDNSDKMQNKEKIIKNVDLLKLNYDYECKKTYLNTIISTGKNDNKAKINFTENLISKYKNDLNNLNPSRYNLGQSNSNYASEQEIEFNSQRSDCFNNNHNGSLNTIDHCNSNSNQSMKHSAADNIFINNYNFDKEWLKSKNYNNESINNISSNSKNKKFSLINLDDFSLNDKLSFLEQGCILFKRNNYFNKRSCMSNKITSNIFYSSQFNPLDYGFKKYFCAFDQKRNRLNFIKEENFSNNKNSEIYLASITSIKIPQYTKNLVFIKQLYRKFLKNFVSLDEMDEYISRNTHFLVNLYYENCKEKEIKFDNRLYTTEFRRELLNNNNYIIYLKLLSENARVELMFLEYEEVKYWINGLQELVSLKNL